MLFEGAWGTLGSEKLPHRLEGLAVARAQPAVIPDLDKMVRQDMLQKPADEFLSTESADLGLLGAGIFILEGDLAIFQGEDAVIADGHTKDIGR
jgi:hypothetical protein